MTPDRNSPAVKAFCHIINRNVRPQYIGITPEPDCEPNDCFFCVKNKVDRMGGRIQFGWSIWEWPQVYLEAEHHAVYEPPTGPPWIDITPSENPRIHRRLFVSDNSTVYDFSNEGILQDSRRIALNDDPLIQELFRLTAVRVGILNSAPGVGPIALEGDAAEQYAAVQTELACVIESLTVKYTSLNAPCFCGSKRTFRHCHGNTGENPRWRTN